jgi:hypothetical protein
MNEIAKDLEPSDDVLAQLVEEVEEAARTRL